MATVMVVSRLHSHVLPSCESLWVYWLPGMSQNVPLKSASLPTGSGPPTNQQFLGTHESLTCTVHCRDLTDIQAHRPHYSICSNGLHSMLCMRCGLIMWWYWGWRGNRVVSARLRHKRAWVQIAVATLSGNSLWQTVHTHCAFGHQAAKLVAALIRVAGLAESNGSPPTGLWFTSPAGWLPRTGISSGTQCSVIEYGLPLSLLRWCGRQYWETL